MQTKQQIRQLLAAQNIKPKKTLGQHFLIDLNLMKKLVDSAKIQKNDIILEPGCGTGSLTQELAKKAGCVLAVEMDKNLAKIAAEMLKTSKNTEIINADILKNKNNVNPEIIEKIKSAQKKCPGRLLLVSNLPYNIASPLMLNLVTGTAAADKMYVTVQEEIADKMTTKPNNKNYGTLSIILAATGSVKKLRTLKPSVFWPAPKVNSAMISFTRSKSKIKKIKDISLLAEVVALFMQHRRKTVKACTKFAKGHLKNITDWLQLFGACNINPQKRPEQISPQKYVNIANYCCRLLKSNTTG